MNRSAPALLLGVILAGPAPRPPRAPSAAPLVVFLGDSLTAGLGLGEAQAYPALVGEELRKREHPVRIVNAGVSGDTTAGGLRRLDWLLKQRPDVLVVALGANDGLRGLPVEAAEKNLRDIVVRARKAGSKVLLCGMLVPTSYGPAYGEAFASIYPRLARELKVPLMPFLLDGVAGEAALNQEDGVHPNAEGQRRVAANLLPRLLPLLAQKKPVSRPPRPG